VVLPGTSRVSLRFLAMTMKGGPPRGSFVYSGAEQPVAVSFPGNPLLGISYTSP
jgi:hypothetical protein